MATASAVAEAPSTTTTNSTVEQLHADAEAVAAEHGHELGDWYTSEHLLTAARCEHCTATVCLKAEGCGSNSDPLRWLRSRECRPVLPRYRLRKITKPQTFLVVDSERPQYEAVAMRRKAKDAQAIADTLNGVDVKDPALVLRTKVARLRKQLAKAETELAALSPAGLTLVKAATPNPDGSQTPAQVQDSVGDVYYVGAKQAAAA